jgi:hypothetical protein
MADKTGSIKPKKAVKNRQARMISFSDVGLTAITRYMLTNITRYLSAGWHQAVRHRARYVKQAKPKPCSKAEHAAESRERER